MDWKKLGKALLFPPIAVPLLLLPLSTALLIYAMLKWEENDPLRIAAYLLAFYTLVIWSARLPRMIRFLGQKKRQNRYMTTWSEDLRLRMNVTLSGSLLWNGAYAALQLGMGIYHHSAWFYSLCGYYACLAVIRFFLLKHTLRHRPGEALRREWKRYRACGWSFLFMNLALSGMMLYMIKENRTMRHHEITTIAMAAYTFTSMTFAVVNVIKYRKYNSPAMSAAKAVSLASACVSMLTLENTMLTTFRQSDMTPQVKMLFLSLSGGAISLFIIAMAIYMIIMSSKKLKCIGE